MILRISALLPARLFLLLGVVSFVAVTLSAAAATYIPTKCPLECVCQMNKDSQIVTVCKKGEMLQIPVTFIDTHVQVLIIKGPRNNLAIGPIFRSFLELQVLRIIDSNVPAVGSNSFYGLANLRTLDLSRNNISTLDKSEFNGLGNLRDLDLSHNKVRRMPSGAFYYLQNLTRLNLAHNQVDELVQRQFLMLVNLYELDLSGNPLKDLPPKVFEDVQGLRVLKLRGCRLKNVNPRMYNILPKLRELDLGYNQFEYLDKDEFRDLKRLEVLRLDGNQLTVLVDSLFVAQANLQWLDVSRNRLVKLDSLVFSSLSNLTHLDVSYNKFTSLDEATMEPLVDGLQVFNVSGNVNLNLNDLLPILKSLSKLQSLSVADFGRMPSNVLSSVPEIRALNLSGNHLSSVDLHILAGLGHLALLDLSRNQLNGVTERTAARLERIADVRLDNNPLICDKCHMGAIINRIPNLMWKNFPSCFFPESLRGYTVGEVDPLGLEFCIDFVETEDMNAASTSNDILRQGRQNMLTFLIASGAILMTLFFLIFVAWYTRHRAQYYTHEDQLDEGHVKQQPLSQHLNEMSTLFIADGTLISNHEINFKFPIDDHPICTIDEYILPSAQPTIGKYIPSSG